MTYFAVTRNAGPAWADGKGAFDQPGAGDHAAFMNALAVDGLILFAGPLGGSEHGRLRVLLIADAPRVADLHRRLAAGPRELTQRVVTASVEPWNLLVGAHQLGPASAATH